MRLLTAIALLILLACAAPPVDQEAEAQTLMDLSRAWAQAANANDHEKTLDFWAEDAVVMSPDQPALKGHDAIRGMLEGSSQIPGFEVNWEPKEAYVSKCGDMGYVLAHNYFKFQDSTGNTITTFNKAVEIWKKQEDGSWKNAVDIFNADPTLTSIR